MNFFKPLLCQPSTSSSFLGRGNYLYLYFSYLPGKPDNPITTHEVAGINLDVRTAPPDTAGQIIKTSLQSHLSDQQSVYLGRLSQASTGRYRCEVSGEGPMFATDSAYADLLVVVVPQNGPRITGLHKKRSGVSYNLWVVTSPAKHSTMIVTSFVI